jgi:hypothetical protein
MPGPGFNSTRLVLPSLCMPALPSSHTSSDVVEGRMSNQPKIMIDLDWFQIDPDIQTRELHDYELLGLFRELYREYGPEALPPVVVFHDSDDVYWLADGHYRVIAAREALSKEGPRALMAELRLGSKRDAILYAAGANAKHGQPLAPHEKRRVVRRLLEDPEWKQWSDREIARHTGVSHVLVGAVRKMIALEAAASGNALQIAAPTVTVQRGGTTYQMRTANIGRAHSVPNATTPNKDDVDDGMEAVVTEGFDRLQNAWRAATYEARRAFRDWVSERPMEDYGPVRTSSEHTERFSTVIAQVCSTGDVA